MDNYENENKGFSYNYSAKERIEVKKIRDKYTKPTKEEDMMARLIRLDSSVTSTAVTVALVIGIIGTLILGLGMSLCMTDLGDIIDLSHEVSMLVGIFIGISGGIILTLAYPFYNLIVKRKRKKLAPEIIRLSDELMK